MLGAHEARPDPLRCPLKAHLGRALERFESRAFKLPMAPKAKRCGRPLAGLACISWLAGCPSHAYRVQDMVHRLLKLKRLRRATQLCTDAPQVPHRLPRCHTFLRRDLFRVTPCRGPCQADRRPATGQQPGHWLKVSRLPHTKAFRRTHNFIYSRDDRIRLSLYAVASLSEPMSQPMAIVNACSQSTTLRACLELLLDLARGQVLGTMSALSTVRCTLERHMLRSG